MTLTLDKNHGFARFVSCADGAGLIKISAQVARRAMGTAMDFQIFPPEEDLPRLQASSDGQK